MLLLYSERLSASDEQENFRRAASPLRAFPDLREEPLPLERDQAEQRGDRGGG